jgi:20S proteasome alpha/beta subunit
VEYAIEAIKLGSTAIGIQTDEGVILAVEKRITSPLMEPTSIEKVRQQIVFRIRIRIWEDENDSHNRK